MAENKRRNAIQHWLQTVDVKVEPLQGLEIADQNSKGTVIIAAYNEEKQIVEALESATDECNAGLDVLVVNNKSVDATPTLVQEFARRCTSSPVALIDCWEGQGYGVTRRKAFAQTLAQYLYCHPHADKQHHVVMLDADSRLGREYGEHHQRLVEEGCWDAIGVTYKFPPDVDRVIFEAVGIPDYLFSIAQLSSKVTSAGMAIIQTASQGGAVEVGSLAQIGLSDFLRYDIDDTDRFLGWKVTEMGGKVGFNPAVTTHCERRFTAELALGLQMNESYGKIDPVQMRRLQGSMRPEKIAEVMATTSKKNYLEFHKQRLQSFVRRNIVTPIRNGQLSAEALTNHLQNNSLTIDIYQEDAVEKLAGFFIKSDEMLSKIYQ